MNPPEKFSAKYHWLLVLNFLVVFVFLHLRTLVLKHSLKIFRSVHNWNKFLDVTEESRVPWTRNSNLGPFALHSQALLSVLLLLENQFLFKLSSERNIIAFLVYKCRINWESVHLLSVVFVSWPLQTSIIFSRFVL